MCNNERVVVFYLISQCISRNLFLVSLCMHGMPISHRSLLFVSTQQLFPYCDLDIIRTYVTCYVIVVVCERCYGLKEQLTSHFYMTVILECFDDTCTYAQGFNIITCCNARAPKRASRCTLLYT
jgi:hypothetical protein